VVGVGLEAGSKPELLVALAILDTPGALIVCNGYKDRAYVETALLAQRLGRTPIIVIDRFRELDLIIKTSQELGIRPHIGVRGRLSARGAGKWVESTGRRSKFGLSPDELQPGPLVHSLGTALRSSFVGFLIALVGVWVKAQPGERAPERSAAVEPLAGEAEPA